MSCETCVCNFIRGEVLIGDLGNQCSGSIDSMFGCSTATPALRKIGNVESLNLFVESEIRGLSSKTNAIETLSCAQTIINNVRISLKLNCVNQENFKLAFYGSDSGSTDSGSIIDRRICGSIKSCTYLKTEKYGISNVILEIKDSLGNTLSTLVEGSDYKSDEFGIEFLGDFVLASGESIYASYDYDESSFRSTQVLTEIKKPQRIYFKGINLNGDTPYHMDIFKVVLQPASTLELISSDNFQTIDLNGIVMRDCTKDYGLSQFMELKEGISNGRCS